MVYDTPDPRQKFSFSLKPSDNSGRIWQLACNSEDEKKEWISILKLCRRSEKATNEIIRIEM